MKDYVEIEVTAQTNIVGSKCSTVIEVNREDWDALSNREKDKELLGVLFNMIDWSWEVIE